MLYFLLFIYAYLFLYLYIYPRSTPILYRITHTFIAYTHIAYIHTYWARHARQNPHVGHAWTCSTPKVVCSSTMGYISTNIFLPRFDLKIIFLLKDFPCLGCIKSLDRWFLVPYYFYLFSFFAIFLSLFIVFRKRMIQIDGCERPVKSLNWSFFRSLVSVLSGVDWGDRPVESFALILLSWWVWRTYQIFCVVLLWLCSPCIVLLFLDRVDDIWWMWLTCYVCSFFPV